MKLLQRGVALALLTTFTLASETALAQSIFQVGG